METNVQTDKKGKKGKKFEAQAQTAETQAAGAGAAAKTAAEGATDAAIEKAKGAPRPRKWDYGIVNEATIKRAAESPRVAKDIEVAWSHTEDNPTVETYFTQYGENKRTDARHGLRVMCRRGLIKIVHADGNEYPREYVPAEPKAETETKAETAEEGAQN